MSTDSALVGVQPKPPSACSSKRPVSESGWQPAKKSRKGPPSANNLTPQSVTPPAAQQTTTTYSHRVLNNTKTINVINHASSSGSARAINEVNRSNVLHDTNSSQDANSDSDSEFEAALRKKVQLGTPCYVCRRNIGRYRPKKRAPRIAAAVNRPEENGKELFEVENGLVCVCLANF